ncbi:ladderlectin-like [Fundulus heteroclitus]|uniref:ladderlectin-like n=1 Tax=Fundulus heteroclitus TaxID=8078 RepID=UPI00165C4067|nr:ladderlectin-like [Fundulus heteroclitus]
MKVLTGLLFLCALLALSQAAAVAGNMGDPAGVEIELAAEEAVVDEEVDMVKRSNSCPPGWSLIKSRCFRYVAKALSWARAEKNCLSMGANLASVNDLDEYHQVQSLITWVSHGSKETWIGGTNAQETSVWLWSDGSPLRYTNWCRGEPNNYKGGQLCLVINYSGEKCWDDDFCYVQLPSVCAKKI